VDLLPRQRAATILGWRRTVDALPTGAWAAFDGVAVHDLRLRRARVRDAPGYRNWVAAGQDAP
jgi:hypothetical protein